MERLYNGVVARLTAEVDATNDLLAFEMVKGTMPTEAEFRVIIGEEICRVLEVTGTTLRVEREAEGTTSASYQIGTYIYLIVTAGALEAHRNQPVPDTQALLHKAADDAVRFLVSLSQLTESRTYTLPNKNGVLVVYSDLEGHMNATGSDVHGLGTLSTQAADSVDISGGSINGTEIGQNEPAPGRFSTLNSEEIIQVDGQPVLNTPAPNWQEPQGSDSRVSFDPASVDLPTLATVVATLMRDLMNHHQILKKT